MGVLVQAEFGTLDIFEGVVGRREGGRDGVMSVYE